MKQTLLLIFLSFLSFSLVAQLSFPEEEMSIGFDATTTYDLKTDLDLSNAGSEDEVFVWNVQTVEAPQEWKFYVCDLNKCYGPGTTFVDATASNTLEGGITKALNFHLLPGETPGMGTYVFNIAAASDPSTAVASVTLIFDGTIVDTKETQIDQLSVFPNPVTDYFQLDNPDNIASSVILYDILGKQIKKFDVASGDSYYVGDINSGRYFARIFDNEGQSLKTLRIVKSSLRP